MLESYFFIMFLHKCVPLTYFLKFNKVVIKILLPYFIYYLNLKYLLCNGPWPSCFRLPIVRKRNCPAGKFVRTVPNALSPLFPVRGRRERPEGRIYWQTLHCNRPAETK